MKLNYREKVILGVLLAVVICIVGFVGLIKPRNEEIKEDEKTLIAKQEEQADLEKRIARIEPLKKDINDTYEETNKLVSDFIPLGEISNSVQIDQYMQHYAEECGVHIDNLEISNPKESELNYYYLENEGMPASDMRSTADLNGDYAEADSKYTAESTALSQRNVESVIQSQYGIRVTGTREALWKYLKAVDDLNKTMIVNQVRIDDYSFGADKEEEGNSTQVDSPENAEGQPAEGEDAEQPTDAEGETPVDANETPVPAPAPAELSLENEATSSIQIIISLYSVYDMPKPDVNE